MKSYVSTRTHQTPIGFYKAIVQGIGDDGGLLVPDFELPRLDLNSLVGLDYVSLATKVMSVFAPEGAKDLLRKACMSAYGEGLFPEEVVPVRKVGETFVAEIFHGLTAAFKDIALSILPHLMTISLGQLGDKRRICVLVATSGDTGKAALEGFKDVAGTQIIVFFPTDGVSAIQKRQMVSQEGSNVKVVGIRGNFDDAQKAVKAAFADPAILQACKEGNALLSSANSINIGRLVPQIVYYFSSYLELVRRGEVRMGEKVNFCVPSGNFGNCLAGWLAKSMGLPVGKFLVASNRNNVLTDFFNTGVYDANREFYKTNAPAMDILVSSNLERLVWYMTGKDGSKVASFMESLREEGVYRIDRETLGNIRKEFVAGSLDEPEVLSTIRECYERTGYILDTHTACGYGFLQEYISSTGDPTKTVLISTASPYKFPESVLEALTGEKTEACEAMNHLERISGTPVPGPLQGINEKKVLHTLVIDREEIPSFIAKTVEEKQDGNES